MLILFLFIFDVQCFLSHLNKTRLFYSTWKSIKNQSTFFGKRKWKTFTKRIRRIKSEKFKFDIFSPVGCIFSFPLPVLPEEKVIFDKIFENFLWKFKLCQTRWSWNEIEVTTQKLFDFKKSLCHCCCILWEKPSIFLNQRILQRTWWSLPTFFRFLLSYVTFSLLVFFICQFFKPFQ